MIFITRRYPYLVYKKTIVDTGKSCKLTSRGTYSENIQQFRFYITTFESSSVILRNGLTKNPNL